jgi:LmbE family N-acetylglucosaminyl deacetylase
MSAIFYGGLRKVESREPDGRPQEPWRPHHVLQYMQTTPFEPTLVVDVGEVWEQRTRALLAFRSQIANPEYVPAPDEPQTFVSNPRFFQWIEARARTYGYSIGATHGEPFRYELGPLGVGDLVAFLDREKEFR